MGGPTFGAWYIVAAFASRETMDKLYKRMKKAVRDFNNSEEALKLLPLSIRIAFQSESLP